MSEVQYVSYSLVIVRSFIVKKYEETQAEIASFSQSIEDILVKSIPIGAFSIENKIKVVKERVPLEKVDEAEKLGILLGNAGELGYHTYSKVVTLIIKTEKEYMDTITNVLLRHSKVTRVEQVIKIQRKDEE